MLKHETIISIARKSEINFFVNFIKKLLYVDLLYLLYYIMEFLSIQKNAVYANFVILHIRRSKLYYLLTIYSICGNFFIPNIFLKKNDMNFGFSISTTFINYLLHNDHAKRITVIREIISTHSHGRIVVSKTPNPNDKVAIICPR